MPDRRAEGRNKEQMRGSAKVSGWIKGFADFIRKDSILEREIERRKDIEDFNTRFAKRDRLSNRRKDG